MSALFAEAECGPRTEPVEAEPLSYTRRLTLRKQRQLDAGFHPVTRRPLLPVEEGKTCGGCAHHHREESRSGRQAWHKCDLNATSGAATDLRVRWPACTAFVAAPPAELEGQRQIAEAHE